MPSSRRRIAALTAAAAIILASLLSGGCDNATESGPDVLFSDSFGGADGAFPDGWTQHDDELDPDSPAGNWYIDNGRLYQDADAWGGEDQPEPYLYEGTLITTGDSTWTDYRLTVDVTPEHPYGIGIYFRTTYEEALLQASRSYYRVVIMQSDEYDGPFWRLDQRSSGLYTWLDRNEEYGYTVGETFRVIIEVRDSHVQVYAGDLDNLVLEWDGGDWEELDSGYIGLMCFRQPGCHFDNVTVEEL